MTIGIYVVTAPNGKPYIGQSWDIEGRWSCYKKPERRRLGPKLYYSLVKYGPENFRYEIIKEFDETIEQDELDKAETRLIAEYDAVKKGLNCLTGGRGGKMSNECIEKHRRKKVSKETRAKISALHKNKPKSEAQKGKKLSPEHVLALKNGWIKRKEKERLGKLKPLERDEKGKFVKQNN